METKFRGDISPIRVDKSNLSKQLAVVKLYISNVARTSSPASSSSNYCKKWDRGCGQRSCLGMMLGVCAGAGSPGALCMGSVLSRILSFNCLAMALGTDYWYLIRVELAGRDGGTWEAEQLSSHSRLWQL
ncbi:UNVERIFIED_CONTAM: hypothetical protein K2H54_037083 [Gekko kuhli]